MSTVDLRIVLPELGTVLRIERDHLVERRAEEELAVYQNGCGLEGLLLVQVGLGLQCTGVISPRDLELADVLAIDLRQGGISRSAQVVAVVRPAVT